MEKMILEFSNTVETRFNNLPESIAARFDRQYDDLIRILNEAQNAVVALNEAFVQAGYNKL